MPEAILFFAKKDCDLTLACLVAMAEIYRNDFGVNLLGPTFTSAGSVVAAHLEEATNAAGVQGFSELKNSTIGKILLNARNGGVVESRVVRASKVWEKRKEPADAKKVYCLDLNSLYPSSQVNHANMYGEPTLYSPAEKAHGPRMLTAVSNQNPYGNEYRSCLMLRHELEDRFGEHVLSIRSNHTNQRCAVLPRYWPDAFAVSAVSHGRKPILTFHQHDGFYHVLESGLHHEFCKFRTPENDFRNSVKYQLTMEAHERHRKHCERVFGRHFELRFVQTTDCNFHTSYTMRNGSTFSDMGVALASVRRDRPELCISASHPSSMSIDEVLSDKRRPDGTLLTGFAVIKAKFDAKRHLGTEQFGFLVEASAITKDMLTPYTLGQIERIARLQTPDPEEVERVLSKFYESLKNIRRLHMRNSHSRWVTVTLDHARFLKFIGCEITDVAHVVLFASLTNESQKLHPYRRTIENLLQRREDYQRELKTLKIMHSPGVDERKRMELLKTLIFLAKIR